MPKTAKVKHCIVYVPGFDSLAVTICPELLLLPLRSYACTDRVMCPNPRPSSDAHTSLFCVRHVYSPHGTMKRQS